MESIKSNARIGFGSSSYGIFLNRVCALNRHERCQRGTLLLAPGLLKRRVGWVLGWLLQAAMLGFGLVVNSFLIIGLIFAGLWIAAILVGRKGEAARAALLASRTPDA
jgi:hypothetical protein